MKRRPTTSPDKPVLDESTFQQLLAAAHTLQEHRDRQRPPEPPAAPPEIQKSDHTQTLSQIVETQRLIQVQHLDLASAAALIAERVRKITGAGGAAVGIVENDQLLYQAASGSAAAEVGQRISLDAYLCVDGLRDGHTVQVSDANKDAKVRAELCRERGIQALVAAPVFHDDKISGVLELRFAETNAFEEQDVRTCQLMAGLVGEVMVRRADAEWKQALATERATLLDALERLKPQLEKLVGEAPEAIAEAAANPAPLSVNGAPAAANKVATENVSGELCRGCGYRFEGQEFFCGICGVERGHDAKDGDSISPLLAQLADQEMPEEPGADNGLSPLAPSLEEILSRYSAESAEDESAIGISGLNKTTGVPRTGSSKPDASHSASSGELAPLPAELEEIVARFAGEEFSSGEDEFAPEGGFNRPAPVSAAQPNSIEHSVALPSHSIVQVDRPEEFFSEPLASGKETSAQLAPVEEENGAQAEPAAITPTYPWTSAAKARQWLESVSGHSPARLFMARQWQRQRANIYLGTAGLILLVVLFGWGARSAPGVSPATAKKATPAGTDEASIPAQPQLTFFQQLLVSLGLAEAPQAPVYQGDPAIKVWVDVHTALYYCPGTELYGKTDAGKFTTQRDAQQDQFEPASRQPCN